MRPLPSIVPADRLDRNIAECREHADRYKRLSDHYKRLSSASGISKDRAAALKNIARTYVGLAGQLDRLASLARNEQRQGAGLLAPSGDTAQGQGQLHVKVPCDVGGDATGKLR
ncbi:hypothetical protein [Bradyrhizobium japonicum]|uniref:hypothetical protein n=1 Tax=Bradyrhizobium japonicum TaxID=375 RepID=UPI001F0A28B8|nr:hypothetical protein [Bradyrhizobium japonicum]